MKMDAKKCDRCGNFYELKSAKETKYPNKFETIKDSKHYEERCSKFEICHECAKELYNFLKTERKLKNE